MEHRQHRKNYTNVCCISNIIGSNVLMQLCIDDSLYFSRSKRNLLNFEDIYYNDYHIKTNNSISLHYFNGFGPKAHIRKIAYFLFYIFHFFFFLTVKRSCEISCY